MKSDGIWECFGRKWVLEVFEKSGEIAHFKGMKKDAACQCPELGTGKAAMIEILNGVESPN